MKFLVYRFHGFLVQVCFLPEIFKDLASSVNESDVGEDQRLDGRRNSRKCFQWQTTVRKSQSLQQGTSVSQTFNDGYTGQCIGRRNGGAGEGQVHRFMIHTHFEILGGGLKSNGSCVTEVHLLEEGWRVQTQPPSFAHPVKTQ